jgi:DNA-binding MarR family transcriptional regulator
MNNSNDKYLESYRSFQLLTEISGDGNLSQREISKRLGIAVGLVNSYLKHLVAKGYIRVKNFPRNRYAYLLTPQGFAEKSRLAYQHLTYLTGLYTTARQDYLALFGRLSAEGVQEVMFCGTDEVAEIAYLSLMESSIRLAGVMDEDGRKEFFGKEVVPLGHVPGKPVVITSLKEREHLSERLLQLGYTVKDLFSIRT